MPFRRTRRSRRPRRRRRFRGRRMMRRTRRVVLDPERHAVDINSVAQTINQVGNVSFINGAPQGIDLQTRIGMQQLNTGMSLTYTVTLAAGAQDNSVVRIAVILYKQQRGLNLPLADVWESSGTSLAPISKRVLENGLIFRMVWSRTLKLDAAHQVFSGAMNKSFRLKTRYVNNGGAAGDCGTGGLWFVAIFDSGAAPLPNINFASRVRFVG